MPRGGIVGIKLSNSLSKAMKRSSSALDRRIKQQVMESLNTLWSRSVAAFIMAVSTQVLVDTGMSLASLYPLATKVSKGAEVRRIIMSKRKSPRRRGSYDMSGSYNPGVPRTRTHGERLGQDAYTFKLLSRPTGTLDFGFEVKVWQFYLHEEGVGQGSPSGGMRALIAGRVAFQSYFSRAFHDAVKPDIKNILTQELFLKQAAGTRPHWGESDG